jgi:phosphoglucosamine mutase
MSRTYFGTDGIRGTVGAAPITADFMLRLGHAVGRVLRRNASKATVLIGKDTRVSGYMIESALEAGFASAGVDVLLTGPLPTPGVAYLTRALRADLGVVISASHNPFADNGVKFFSASGEKLSDQWEMDVEAALAEPPVWADSASLGKARRLADAAGRYLEFCKSTFSQELSLKGLRIVVDGAHGAAYSVAPSVFHELGAEVFAIGCEPNGFNINDRVGATSPQELIAEVLRREADYGVALDGDADRLQLVDSSGRCFDGDELLYAMVSDRLARGEQVPGVVGTLMTNMAVEQALLERGVPLVRAKVGDRYVLEELIARGWQLGGENSGHLLVLERHTTGDAAGRRDAVSAGDDQRPAGCEVRLAAERDAGRREGVRRAGTGRRGAGADPCLGHGARAACDGRGARRCAGASLRGAPGDGRKGRMTNL